MKGISGTELKAAFRRAAVWNTAVQVGPNNGVLFLPSSIKKSAPPDIDDSLGSFFSKDGTPGPITCGGDQPGYLRYDGLDLFLAMFMGTSGNPVRQGATRAYAYTYKWAESIEGIFGTFAKNMVNYIEEHPSIKIAGVTIKGETGKAALQLIVTTISCNKVIDSIVNTLDTYADVTISEESNRVRMSEGVFRINDRDGEALGSGDIVFPASFELSAKRKLKGEYGTYKTPAPNIQDLIDEPTNDGPPEIRLKLTFARHYNQTYLSALGSDTRKKMDMTFTGAVIEGAYKRQITIPMPHLQMLNDDPQDAQGIINEPLEFIVHAASVAPAGMDGITDPFWITGINQRSSDPLTEDAAPDGLRSEASVGDATSG